MLIILVLFAHLIGLFNHFCIRLIYLYAELRFLDYKDKGIREFRGWYLSRRDYISVENRMRA